jgi:hypothetical protein
MSDHRAIAVVTSVMRFLLEQIREEISDIGEFSITTKAPHTIPANPDKNGLNLFLYNVSTNSGYFSSDLPTRNSAGELIERPRVSLNLHYLLTVFTIDSDEILGQEMLASGLRILHEKPIITRKLIGDLKQTITPGSPARLRDLLASDLEHQVELVKISFQPLSLDEMTKLWSSFFQTNYRISIPYQATVILLESKQESRPVLPVRDRVVHVFQFKQPLIDKLEPQVIGASEDTQLLIVGRNLKADKVIIKFRNISLEPEPKNITDTKIAIAVPDNLSAGINTVQVIHSLTLSSNPDPYRIFQSNIVAFMFAPKIISPSPIIVQHGSDFELRFKPSIGPEQRVVLLLTPQRREGTLLNDLAFTQPPRTLGSEPINTLNIRTDNIPVGRYFIRLEVDQAQSKLEVGNDDPTSENYNKLIGPELIIL